MIDNPREYEVMAAVEEGHWWYQTLHDLVLQTLKTHRLSEASRIIDAGCGTGGLLQKLRQAGYRHASGFDLSEDAVHWCRERGLNARQGNLTALVSIEAPDRFDAIVSNDTLCYLDPAEQRQFIVTAFERLNPSGLLIMNLPALAAFRGTHDRAVGLLHRFNRPGVRKLVANSGFVTITLRHWPFLLAPPIFLVRTWQRLTEDPASTVKPTSDLKQYSGFVNTFLHNLIRLEIATLPVTPFGSSLFCVLQRPAR